MAPCANAAVIRILLGCQNWIPHLRAVDFCPVHKSTQSIAACASSARASLELGDLLLPLLCCKVPVHLSSTCGALHPRSAAVNSNSERCAGRLVALCRTATHGDVCAYSDAFLSRGTGLMSGTVRLLRSQQVNQVPPRLPLAPEHRNSPALGSISAMDSARGLYSRLAGVNPDQDIDEGMDSLLSLPQINPNQPREWLHIDPQGKTRYALVKHRLLFSWSGVFDWHACFMQISLYITYNTTLSCLFNVV